MIEFEAPRAPGLRVALRPYCEGVDRALVAGHWSRHVRALPPFSAWPEDAFRRHLDRQVSAIDRGGALVAVPPGSEDQQFGFVVGRLGPEPVLDFLYVRNAWRQLGIGTLLMQHAFPSLGSAPIWLSHPGRAVPHLRRRWRLTFNPYLAV